MGQSEFDSALSNDVGLTPYLRMRQEGVTENEGRTVEWLLKSGNLSCASAVKDTAEALAISEAMIVRILKLLGSSNFRNLRSTLEDYFSQSGQVLPSELAFGEAPQDVVNKVFNITLCTIMEGQSIVNVDEIHRTARFFCQARQWDLYGTGRSNVICADVQHEFLRIGVCCQAYPDIHVIVMSTSLLQGGDAMLVVIHSRQTSNIKTAVELAKKNGAGIICITHSYHSPITKLANYIIYSPTPEMPLLSRSVSAKILQLTLLDAFFVSTTQLNIEQANINIQKAGVTVDFFSSGILKQEKDNSAIIKLPVPLP